MPDAFIRSAEKGVRFLKYYSFGMSRRRFARASPSCFCARLYFVSRASASGDGPTRLSERGTVLYRWRNNEKKKRLYTHTRTQHRSDHGCLCVEVSEEHI